MKFITQISVLVVFLNAGTTAWTIENPNVGSPFRSSNAPTHSGQRQRFITRPNTNPYGQASNDIVTGNVAGGKHFRGVVPYGSSYYSRAYTNEAGSAAVNRFIRRSTDVISNDRNPGQVRRYYDPRRTVSSLRQLDGQSALTAPALSPQSRQRDFISPSTDTFLQQPIQQRPLSANTMDLEQILTRQEKLRQQTAERDTEDTEKDTEDEKNFFDIKFTPERQEQTEDPSVKEETETKLNPVEQVLAEIQKEQAEALKQEKSILEKEQPEKTEDGQTNRLDPKSDLLPKIDPDKLRDQGKDVLGEHETFQSLAEEKFSEYMEIAEDFIREDQFYKAADTYSLANVWKPKDPRGYLGQSFSLFAAGEYMSSAYYLSRAFELDSTIAQEKFDLADFVGDRDIYENRVLEMTTWQERSGSGELAFLLAYVSYQDNKATRAVDAIEKAKTAMPNSRAVAALKAIIDPEPVME